MRRQVLVTCGGGLQGHTLIRELRAIGSVGIHVIDSNRESPGRYFADEYVVGPPVAQSDDYIEFLRGYIGEHAIDAVIPATPHDLELLAGARPDLESASGCRVAVSAPELLAVLLHKRRCHRWLRQHGIATLDEIEPAEVASRLPAIGKRNDQWGGKGALIVTDGAQIDERRDLDDYLWTPYLAEFDEFSVDFCIDFDGQASEPIVRQRLATVGGFAVVMEQARFPPAVRKELGRLIGLLAGQGGRGIFNLQLLCEARRNYYVSDVNPRIGTSAVVAARLGAGLCAHLLDGGPARPTPVRRLKVVRQMTESVIESRDLGRVGAIVFDLDDTLISHKDWILAKVDSVAARYVPEQRRRFIDAAAMYVDEGKAFCLYDRLCESFGLEDIRDRLIEAHRQFVPDTISVYDDVEAILDRLGKKYRLGLLTDNPAESQQQKLDRFPYRDRFDRILLTDELGRSKPAPEPFASMAEALGREPGEMVMVGDNFHRDIAGALDAGFACGFQIERADRMVNSASRRAHAGEFVTISSLRELGWYL